ncbi:MAG: nicotinate-nicotinamide nucleotide adenylyltransferase [Candidatus Latescibacterota bacterium]|jgi:nicotinate (nicotinamide) nucleotide adenylyltransferase
MAFDEQTLNHYQTLINQLNPHGSPTAKMIHQNTQDYALKVGILDASFNPFTLAHESLIQTSKETLKLDSMLLMLSLANVDKELFGATLEQRLAMLTEYAKQHHLSVAICSHARFVDKIMALTPCYAPNTQFYFIVGYDTLVRLFDPKYYADMQADLQKLFQTCHFIAANRENNDQRVLDAFLKKSDVQPFSKRIHTISLPLNMAQISSTQVRNNIQSKQPIEHLVPQVISKAIHYLHLYSN